jgi:hypothetical protein
VTENNPANVSSVVTYSTYAWNEKEIYTTIRVPGYAINPATWVRWHMNRRIPTVLV